MTDIDKLLGKWAYLDAKRDTDWDDFEVGDIKELIAAVRAKPADPSPRPERIELNGEAYVRADLHNDALMKLKMERDASGKYLRMVDSLRPKAEAFDALSLDAPLPGVVEEWQVKAEAFDSLRFIGMVDEKAVFEANDTRFAALPHDKLADVFPQEASGE